jgi:hypothetical protein
MVRKIKLDGFYAVSGIVFMIVLVGTVLLRMWFGILDVSNVIGLVLAYFIINGLVGLYVSKSEFSVRHSKTFGFITVLGIVFLLFLFSMFAGLLNMFEFLPYDFRFGSFLFFLFGGPVFLTVGVLGIGRQYFHNNNQSLFRLLAVLIVVVIPILIFTYVYYSWMNALTVAF